MSAQPEPISLDKRRIDAFYQEIRDDFASRDKHDASGIIKLKTLHDRKMYEGGTKFYDTFEKCADEQFGIETRQRATQLVIFACAILGARKRFDDDSINGTERFNERYVRTLGIDMKNGTSQKLDALLDDAQSIYNEKSSQKGYTHQLALDAAIITIRTRESVEAKTNKPNRQLEKLEGRAAMAATAAREETETPQAADETTNMKDDENANDELEIALRTALEAIRAAQDNGATMDGVIGEYCTEDRERWAELLAMLDDLNEVITDGIELFGEDQRFVSPQAKAEWDQYMAERDHDDDSESEPEDRREKAETDEPKPKTPRKGK